MRKLYDPWLNMCRRYGWEPATGKEPVDECKAAYRRSVKERRKQKRGKR